MQHQALVTRTDDLTMEDIYRDSGLYASEDMFSPPAERRPHVIRFELTSGCDYRQCSFCDGFDGVPFQEKSGEEYRGHVDAVLDKVGWQSPLAKRLERIFIGGGNALGVETQKLSDAIVFTRSSFVHNTDRYPRRIAVYGRTESIKEKGVDGLGELNLPSVYSNCTWSTAYHMPDGFGLGLIYWGLESGSTDVLQYINKGCTQEDILLAGEALRGAREAGARLDTSVIVMPGLGGMRYHDQHIEQTAMVLGEIRPRFLTFMGINPDPRSAYARMMEREVGGGTNRPLTNAELASQMIDIVDEMPAFPSKIGCFGPEIDAVGHNPLSFTSFDTWRGFGKDGFVKKSRMFLERVQRDGSRSASNDPIYGYTNYSGTARNI